MRFIPSTAAIHCRRLLQVTDIRVARLRAQRAKTFSIRCEISIPYSIRDKSFSYHRPKTRRNQVRAEKLAAMDNFTIPGAMLMGFRSTRTTIIRFPIPTLPIRELDRPKFDKALLRGLSARMRNWETMAIIHLGVRRAFNPTT